MEVLVQLDGKTACIEVDTGAAVSVLSQKTQESLFPGAVLRHAQTVLKTYTGDSLPVLGQLDTTIQYGSYSGNHSLFVVHGEWTQFVWM